MQELIPYKPDSPPTYGGFELPALDANGEPIIVDGKPKLIELFHGTSIEQLRAVTDLLSNFGVYMDNQTSIRERSMQVNEEITAASAAAAAASEPSN